ncbi:MAG: hypothetical protein E6I14_10880 [Chloroflexi bacterium]|nr:MAG: hypothetical protein E6I14_10880 [Chloroflexota bacterium]
MLITVPVSWLREYVDITVPIDELALKLHMSSTEVKGVERPWWDDKIRTARVEKLAKHPNADKLQLATVDYGAGAQKTVVTGATNLTEGAIVPYADEGATIIDGHTGERTILRGKPMRGIKSEGMVLSEKELGLSDEHEGIHILDANLPVGVALREVLGETVLALELQPNRPDCLGVVGIAREVAALRVSRMTTPARGSQRRCSPESASARHPRGCRRVWSLRVCARSTTSSTSRTTSCSSSASPSTPTTIAGCAADSWSRGRLGAASRSERSMESTASFLRARS